MDLSHLGITNEELVDRIVQKAVDRITEDYPVSMDDEPAYGPPSIETRVLDLVMKMTEARVDEAVEVIAAKYVEPISAEALENVTFQMTNEWGEKKGKSFTFREYLVDRAENYMHEPVDHNGKSKQEAGSFGFSKVGTRLNYMIDRHLQHHINEAMKKAFADLNSAVVKDLTQATIAAIKSIEIKVGTSVKTKT